MKYKIIALTFVVSVFLSSTIYTTSAQPTPQQEQNLLSDPDFGIPQGKNVDYEMKDYTMTLSPELSREMINYSGRHPSFSERVSVWIENAFIWLASISDRISLIYAKLTNNTEMQLRAEEAIQEYTKSMYYNKAAIGL